MNKLTQRENVFNNHEPYQVKRNGFDLTHKTISSWDMGKLYPVSCVEVYPNDYFRTNAQYRMMLDSLFKPIYSNIRIKFKQFFVSYRSMWKKWRNYYTGGRDGNYTTLEPKVNINCPSNIKGSLFDYLGFPLQSQFNGSTEPVLVSAFPFVAYDFIYYWNFINPHLQENIIYNIQDQLFIDKTDRDTYNVDENQFTIFLNNDFYTVVDGRPMYFRNIMPFFGTQSTTGQSTRYIYKGCTLNDYCPIGCTSKDGSRSVFPRIPLAFAQADSSTSGKYIIYGSGSTFAKNFSLADTCNIANIGYLYNVNWEKDYFTSAYKNRQLGTAASVPLSSHLDNFNPDYAQIGSFNAGFYDIVTGTTINDKVVQVGNVSGSNASISAKSGTLSQGDRLGIQVQGAVVSGDSLIGDYMKKYINNITALTSSFTANDLRLFFAIQQIQEGALLAQKSFEYTSYLKYFFGKGPSHEDLQQPSFIGGFNSVFYTSEVMQTAPTTDTVVGDYAGKGQSIDSGYLGDYNVDEPGCIMTLMYIVPANISQSSQGINRMWQRDDRFDYYNPAFAHLGLQDIRKNELYAIGKQTEDEKVFGYTGAFNELRYIPDTVTSDMRDTLDVWHLARKYVSQQNLTSEYIKCRPSKRIFSTQLANVPNITGIVNLVMIAYRDLPELAIPELLDHRY